MWIRNSSRYPDEDVLQCVEFAVRDVDMRRVCVNVKNGGLGGAAYNGVPEISNAPRGGALPRHVAPRPGQRALAAGAGELPLQGPDETGPRNRFPFFVCRDWREWLVKLAAHEAKHIEQFRNRDVCSELSCEWFALERLEEFRAPAQLALPGM